jgi:hypothetical protein
MDDQRITPEQLYAELGPEYQALKKEICEAMNNAQAGRIIADSEELVRDAVAEFRQRAFQKAIDLRARQAAQEDFSPSAQRPRPQVEE